MTNVDVGLTKEDWVIVLDALENYKAKNVSIEIMSTMLETILPLDKMTVEQQLKFKQTKADEKKKRDEEQSELNKKIELVKAKITLGNLN